MKMLQKRKRSENSRERRKKIHHNKREETQRLKEASIPTRVALSAPSTASVLAAVASGLGVAVVSRRLIDDTVIEWPRAAGLPDLPTGATVARSSPGEDSAIARELIADIESELLGYEA